MSNPPPRQLVCFDSVGCTPPRVMLAPAGARLPPGVRPVVGFAIAADNGRSGAHAGAAGLIHLTAGVAAHGPCLGLVHAVVAPSRRLRTECHGVSHAASAFTNVDTNRSAGRRLATEPHGVADAAGHGRTAGALGSFAAPPNRHGASAFTVVAANRRTGHRLATQCHGVADAARHGRTAGALGLGLSFAAPPNRHGASAFTVSGSGTTGLRGVAARALDLGEDGEGEEDLIDEYRYQDAQRQMQSVLQLICLKTRVKVAVHLGLVPSGQMSRRMLNAIGHVDPAAPVYHWVIHRCHARLQEYLGVNLYEEVIIATPSDGAFNWFVTRGNELYLGVTELMVEIKYAVLHNETWRAAVRDHEVYDYAPTILSELAGVLFEISSNIDIACFKRPDPWVIQRMVENHALALLHLEEALLDFDEVLATAEPVDDARTARELRMHYNLLFAQDVPAMGYMSGIGNTDTKGILLFLGVLKSMIRQLRGQWN